MKLLKGIWIGFWSGLFLGLLLKWIQSVTGENVYNLLLNVDFLPFADALVWNELAEFILHLMVSLIIGILFVYIAKRREYTFGQLTLLSLVICIPFYLLFFPLALLAQNYDVPEVLDAGAILYWLLAHLAYALILPVLYKMFQRKNAASQ